MYIGDMIGAEEVCKLLDISRPTLKKYRLQYEISEFKIKRELKFSKTEIVYKLYTRLYPVSEKVNFGIFTSRNNFESLKIDEYTYDLRMIEIPDGHGAISLICHLMTEIQNGKYIHLLVDQSNTFLKAMNFFGAFKMHLNSRVFWDEKVLESISEIKYDTVIKLPIKRLGVVGAHYNLADDLVVSLLAQGYSQDICSYIGWAIGELADNSSTHAKIHPCFIYFEQFGQDKRYLQFTIGDTGIGIPTSLKQNARYSNLRENKALLMSFKPNVSGRADSEDRGKGLTDVLKIAMECGSRIRVESNNLGFFLIFDSGNDDFLPVTPLFQSSGTVISILFIDGNFASLEREDVSNYIEKCLEKI